MPNLTLNLGQVKITPFFWSLAISVVLASFFFWRKLREDYADEEIFKTTLILFFSSLFFSRLIFIFFHLEKFDFSLGRWLSISTFPGFSVLGAFWGGVLTLAWMFSKYKINIWEGLDSLSQPLLIFVSLGGLGSFLEKGSLRGLAFSGVGILGFVVLEFLRKRYRTFSWYKSGKTGFLFWSTSLYVFALCSILDFVLGVALYLEELFWCLTILVSVGIIYYRSERDFKEDFRKLIKRRKKGESCLSV